MRKSSPKVHRKLKIILGCSAVQDRPSKIGAVRLGIPSWNPARGPSPGIRRQLAFTESQTASKRPSGLTSTRNIRSTDLRDFLRWDPWSSGPSDRAPGSFLKITDQWISVSSVRSADLSYVPPNRKPDGWTGERNFIPRNLPFQPSNAQGVPSNSRSLCHDAHP